MKFNFSLLLLLLSIGLINNSILSTKNGVDSTNIKHLIRRHGDHGDHGDYRDHGEHNISINEANNDQCNNLTLKSGEYDVNLHILSIFILFIFSLIGISLTALSNKVKWLKIPVVLIEFGRYFGSGVIISTAFIHMLMSAVSNLTHPCLSEPFKSYISFAPLFVMLSALIMHLIEFLVMDKVRKDIINNQINNEEFKNEIDIDINSNNLNSCSIYMDLIKTTELKLTTIILELGILSHSIFIGLSLGITKDIKFVPLLVAITFHQFFEGIGLGARIAKIEFNNYKQPMIMIISFILTTPIGISLGIIIHNIYSISTTSLIIHGIFDSISAGILIYAGLVELLAKEISIKSNFIDYPWSLKLLYFFALYCGVAAMAILGIWA